MSRDDPPQADHPGTETGVGVFHRASAHGPLRAHPGAWRLAPSPPHLVVHCRVDAALPWIAGEYTDRGFLLDVVQFVAGSSQRGTLTLTTRGVQRSLAFDRGVLVAAGSTAPAERLGEMMVASGHVPRESLDRVIATLGADRRIGEALVDLGVVRPVDVYAMLQAQAREIFYAGLLETSGGFAFTGGLDGADLPARLNLSAAHLLMTSLQRIDEESILRARMPDVSAVPSRTSRSVSSLAPPARALLDRMDGVRTLGELARAAGLGEFEATRWLHHLVVTGAAQVDPTRSLRDQVTDRVNAVNAVLADIHATVDREGLVPGAAGTVLRFLADSGALDGLFEGAGPDAQGALDPDRVVLNVEAVQTESKLAMAQQALHDHVTFALFAAGTVLPRESGKALARRVQEALSRLDP